MGQGSIGRVYFGCWQETQVAIKVIGNAPIPESAFAPAREVSPDTPVPQIADKALLRTLEREVRHNNTPGPSDAHPVIT